LGKKTFSFSAKGNEQKKFLERQFSQAFSLINTKVNKKRQIKKRLLNGKLNNELQLNK